MSGGWLLPWQKVVGAMPFDWAQFEFMRLALLAVIIIAPMLGCLGTVVVANRLAFFSEAIGHAAFTGIALGVIFGLDNPMWSMVAFALLLTFFVSWLRHKGGLSSDTAIGLVMAFTVSLGIVILSREGDFSRYTKFLIGDMLTISGLDIAGLGILAVVVTAIFLLIFNRLLLSSVSPALARVRMKRPAISEMLFAAMLAVTVTFSLPWIGILVINALLILPAAAARNVSRNVAEFFLWSAVIALVSGVTGLIVSFYAATAAGATIVLVAMGFYLLTFLGAGLLRREG